MPEDLGVVASPRMNKYFSTIKEGCFLAYDVAKKARAKGYDPEKSVSTKLAMTLAERVIGLISVIAPQIGEAGVEKRIEELERKYGVLDWRVAFIVSHEIAQEKYCKFENKLEAIEIGVRTGFAYLTLGVVSAPLEGMTSIELKPRRDGKGEYFCLNFSGPIRNAGGTAAAVCVLIADYVRNKMGYATYDPTEKEILRCPAELQDYHKYVTNLQYHPTEEESKFLMQHIPVEISGEPSEKYEISSAALKDLPRVPTNQLRSGYCLIHSSCIPLKAPKLWKQLDKWGGDFQMDHWKFLEEFIELQKKMKTKSGSGAAKTGDEKIKPDYTYIKDLVAGRPVLGYPLQPGGFRLRYGRSRASGYSGQAIHPCTMHVLQGFIASATQLKVERPGKAAAFMPCDSIDGPIVKLIDGTVLYLKKEEDAIRVRSQVKEILYLGDVLINYGDFYDRNHNLIPAGYCPEWWAREIAKEVGTPERLSEATGISQERCKDILGNPMGKEPTAEEAIIIATKTKTPLHSSWTPFWKLLDMKGMRSLLMQMISNKEELFVLDGREAKRSLEILGIPHKKTIIEGKKAIAFSTDWQKILRKTLDLDREGGIQDAITRAERLDEDANALDFLKDLAPYTIRDKAGTFIGARMGRPEKAKMRKLTGSPHCLFPVGEEGGRLRSIQEALQRGKITAEYPLKRCKRCDKDTVFNRCETCDEPTEQLKKKIQRYDGTEIEVTCTRQSIQIRDIFRSCLRRLNTKDLNPQVYPDLIKGVRGTSNKSHIPEHLIKGILRAKHGISVNKDGTTRYDCSEVTLTHFRPREVHVPHKKLKSLGYTHDVYDNPLESDDQVLELKPQDIVLPCCTAEGYPDEPADEVLFRTANFIDEELSLLYGLEPYYNLKKKNDLVGHYVVGLAPHTSAGIVGRIVGFSGTQGFLAHPLYHAAMRRDCDGDESCILLLMDVFLNFSKKYLPESRGSTMDAPLVVTYVLNPAAVDDMAFNVDRAWTYPLEMYEAAMEYKRPYDIKIDLIGSRLDTPEQFEGMGFTHDTTDLNAGILCSAYKVLPSMSEKLDGQMNLAVMIRACDESDVARLVIEKHFIRDTKGNLRKFTMQQWRCVACNEKFRRIPLIGRCTACKTGKIVFTISEGSVVKYLEPSLELARKYNVPWHLQQDLELLKRRVEDLFGREKEVQTGLGQFG